MALNYAKLALRMITLTPGGKCFLPFGFPRLPGSINNFLVKGKGLAKVRVSGVNPNRFTGS